MTAATNTEGEHGAGEEGVAELFEHDGQLFEAEAVPAVGFGEVQAEPALGRHLLPGARQLGGGRLGGGAGLAGRAVRLQPALGREPQGLVFLRQRYRHYALPFTEDDGHAVARQRDGADRTPFGRHAQPVLVGRRGVEDHRVAVLAQVEGLGRPEEAIPRPHATVPVDRDVHWLAIMLLSFSPFAQGARNKMALVGTPSPDVTRQVRAPSTWQVEVPRT